MRIGLVVPHIFMQDEILPKVIFSPGTLAISLADELTAQGHQVTLFSPGKVITKANNQTTDLSGFKAELHARRDTFLSLLKKHPLTFITLARQVQSELIAVAIADANAGKLDVVHIYGNEEEIALPFAQFCKKPIVLTHHDPFNFLVKYRAVFPKYKQLNWLSLSMIQRRDMPEDTNWVGNIYHGITEDKFTLIKEPKGNYIAFLGRIIEPKGVHLAIAAIKQYNRTNPQTPLNLRIAGKHYSGASDSYWTRCIEPELKDKHIEYVGHLSTNSELQDFLGNARALMVPSVFEEPFGMVSIEALACGTPVLGLDSGAIPEVISIGNSGFVAKKGKTEQETIKALTALIDPTLKLDRKNCRNEFTKRFTLQHMAEQHAKVYQNL